MNKRVFRKTTLTKEDYEKIGIQALASRELLEDDRFSFFRDWFDSSEEYIKKSILENTIHDASEEVTISDKIKRTIFKKKKVQVDELSGQYKLIKKLFKDLKYFVELKKQIDEEIATEKVVISD